MRVAVLNFRVRHAALLGLSIGAGLLLVMLSVAARGTAAPTAPRITSAPRDGDAAAAFAFIGGRAFECAVDSVRFVSCRSPLSYGLLPLGRHVFIVRAISSGGERGDLTVVRWVVVSERSRPAGRPSAYGSSGASQPVAGGGLPISVAGDLPGLLSPGHGGAIPLRIENPYPYPISVSELRVTIDAGSSRRGCDGRADLAVRQSNTVEGAVAVRVPARATVTLPAQGASAPVLWMRNRPVNQDACKGARFTVRYSSVAQKVANE